MMNRKKQKPQLTKIEDLPVDAIRVIAAMANATIKDLGTLLKKTEDPLIEVFISEYSRRLDLIKELIEKKEWEALSRN